MESLMRGRRPIRREFDKYHSELENVLKNDPLDLDQLKVKFKLFNETCEKLSQMDEKIANQFLQEDKPETEEDKEHDEMGEYRLRAETLRVQVAKLLHDNTTKSPESVHSSTTVEIQSQNFKLPEVQMKKFNGDLKEWLGFWAQFQKIDEASHLRPSDKLWYLLQQLQPGTDAHEIASGYPITNENYPKVVEVLKRRFGNEDRLLQVYIRELLKLVISNVNSNEKIPMKTLFLKLDSHLRALNTLNLKNADPATWLFPLVESSLPENVLYNWQHNPLAKEDGSKLNPQKNRLDLLMSFLEQEVDIRQRIEITRSFAGTQKKEQRTTLYQNKRFEKRSPPSALSAFHNTEHNVCVFCDRTNHESKDCFAARRMNYETKMEILKKKGRCFRCAGNHLQSNCTEKNLSCMTCNRGHISVLCKDAKPRREKGTSPKRRWATSREQEPTAKRPRTDDKQINPPQTNNTNANLECSSEVALQTLLIAIVVENKNFIVRVFIDRGSQRSYILSSTARKLKLPINGVERVIHSLFGGRQSETVHHKKYLVKLKSIDGSMEKEFELRDSEKLCGKIPVVAEKYPEIIKELLEKNVRLTEQRGQTPEIQILIGADIYCQIVTGRIVKLSNGAVAVETTYGWTVMGALETNMENNYANHYLSMYVSDASISQLWELDALGIQDKPEVTETEEKMKEDFAKNITKLLDGRYSVKLPWNLNRNLLPTNRPAAYKRLLATSKNLIEKNLFDAYSTIFQDWEKEKFIERVPQPDDVQVIHYLPHRAVVKESPTTPVRPVFDASCRTGKFPSLNDCLMKGENCVLLIPELLHKFREKKVAFIADIRKAFQMIAVDHEDRDVMRFLWWEDEKMQKTIEYRHARVMFGATCSPFILAAVLHHHVMSTEVDKIVGDKLLSTLYIDNCVSSEDTVQDYLTFREKATQLLKIAGMDLRLWYSNVDDMEDESTHVMTVLGMNWDRMNDEIYINTNKFSPPLKITKRTILSSIHKIFDPMGFVSPAVLPMKVLLQKTWIEKIKWDEELPDKEKAIFLKWCQGISTLNEIRIPRLFSNGDRSKENWSLHIFSDACDKSFSATVFVRVENDEHVTVQLLSAKSRLAPVKTLTIPKLELMGCLIGARLAYSVKIALNLQNVDTTYWTDSTTALAWILREHDWGTFVANRTKQIRELTENCKWRHVHGKMNPADLPSRGCSFAELKRLRWWEGPAWLYDTEESWPNCIVNTNEDEVMEELKKTTRIIQTFVSQISQDLQIYSFAKKVRCIAWWFRFL